MKADKALRRVTKIEELISDLTERYSGGAPAIRKALQDAVAAVAVAKEAVNLEATSGMETSPPVKHAASQNAKRAKPGPVKKTVPNKAAVKKAAQAKAAKKAASVKKMAARDPAPGAVAETSV